MLHFHAYNGKIYSDTFFFPATIISWSKTQGLYTAENGATHVLMDCIGDRTTDNIQITITICQMAIALFGNMKQDKGIENTGNIL